MVFGDYWINYAYTCGDFPPLLLLHGTANRWQVFLPIITELASRWKIYAVDFRGHGSSAHTNDYGFGYYVEDIVKFLCDIIGEPAVIFGHSLGGRVATKVAAEYPELVKAVILGDSSLKDPVPSDRMGRFLSGMIQIIKDHETYQDIYQTLRESSSNEFDPVAGLFRAKSLSQLDPNMLQSIIDNGMNLDAPGNHFYGYRPETHIQKIKCPVLILQAEHGMLSDDEVENALEKLPEAYQWRKSRIERVSDG